MGSRRDWRKDGGALGSERQEGGPYQWSWSIKELDRAAGRRCGKGSAANGDGGDELKELAWKGRVDRSPQGCGRGCLADENLCRVVRCCVVVGITGKRSDDIIGPRIHRH